jgi:HEAT repeat protein
LFIMTKALLIALTLVLLPGTGLLAAGAASLDELLPKVAAYDYGQSRVVLTELEQAVRESLASPARTREMEKRLAAFLEGKSTYAAKDAVCRHLGIIGTEVSVPVLARMLATPETAGIARYALERIPAPAAVQALRNALPASTGKARVGIVNSLGSRRDSASIGAVSKLAGAADPAVAAAAVAALGEIGSDASCKPLVELSKKASGGLREAVLEARLKCAEQAAARGDRSGALAAYREMYAPSQPPVIRVAALRGMAAVSGRDSLGSLGEALHSGEPALQAAAIGSLAGVPGGVSVLDTEFAKLAPAAQVRVLAALAERGEVASRQTFLGGAKSASPEVRVAALEGLAKVGSAADVPMLAEAAAGAGPEVAAARRALTVLRGPSIDAAIAAAIPSASAKIKVELVRAAGERVAVSATPALLQAARDSDRDVRRESYRALVNTTTENDLPALAGIVANPVDPADRREAERTLAFVLLRLGGPGVPPILDAYRSSKQAEARASLLMAMGQSGRQEFLPALREALKSAEAEMQRAAILGLTEWPDPAPMPELLEVVKTDAGAARQTLALRGYLRLAGLPSQRTAVQSAVLMAEALKLAKQPDEKKSILGLLPNFACAESLALAESQLGDTAVAAEAKAAADRLRKALATRK